MTLREFALTVLLIFTWGPFNIWLATLLVGG